MTAAPAGGRVDRAAIEAKLREIKGEVDTAARTARPVVAMAGVAAVVAAIGLAYVLGRRKGRRRTTLVEVRRV